SNAGTIREIPPHEIASLKLQDRSSYLVLTL
ncbi:MAG: hypothetical protein QOG55_2886, partial [Acidobacteriaceae bacterium]|nr:hypothetical protein [Acidobacteriaceae bacterium]